MPKKVSKKLVKKVLKGSKKPESKFHLVSYTMKAVIPTGQYANIQPEITVQAETLEQAERAVMPYIETLFARYRDGGVRPIEPTRPVVTPMAPARAVRPTFPTTPEPAPKHPVAPVAAPVAPKPQPTPAPAPVAPVAPAAPAPAPAPAAIVLTVPFNRAKQALE